jgi:hypothetical protein
VLRGRDVVTIHELFDAWFAAVDDTYVAFSIAEGPGGTGADMEAAYAAKDHRARCLNRLVAALAERGIGGVAEGVRRYYEPRGA